MATVDKSFRVKNGAVIEGSSGITAIAAATQDSVIVSGRSGGTGSFAATLTPTTLSASRTITIPDATGTIALTVNNLSVFGATTSAQLAGVISDETGTGVLVFANTPTLITPVLGVATATSINKVAITAPASSATLTIAEGKTLTASNTLTFTGTDTSSVAFGTGGTVAYTSNNLGVFGTTTSSQLSGIISDETGSGALVFAASPTFTGAPLSTTAAVDTNTTQIATTAYVVGQGYAKLASPTFTGTVTLPGDPTLALQAATKQYVDNAAAGLNAHPSVAFATTAALGTTGNLVGGTITTTYANGSSGVGATLTIATSTNWTAITIDGQSLVVGDRVLIKNQATTLQNGIYTVTSVGAVANTTSFVFTRADDQNTTPEMAAGDLVYVTAGTGNGTTLWVQTAKIVTIGTTGVTWSQFSGASTATAGAGLVQNGNAYDVAGTLNRITVNADSVDIASTYVGQTSITTLGTIATGTWQGTLIGATYGGTGVNNGSNTLTLAGNVSHAGSFTQTFTATGNTSVTLPTSGTLATLAGAETLTNKVSVGLTNGQISSSTVTCATAGTGYTLDTFAVASFTSAKYMIQGTSGNERELTELLVTVNAADVHIAEYGIVMTSTDLFTTTATLAAGTVTITVTPTTGNGGLVAKAMRTVIAV